MTELELKVQELQTKYIEYKKDGFSTIEIIKFVLICTSELMDLAKTYLSDIPNSEKKSWVIKNIKALYKKINPDLPWIMEPFETWFENVMLDYVVPGFMDTITTIFKKKGITI